MFSLSRTNRNIHLYDTNDIKPLYEVSLSRWIKLSVCPDKSYSIPITINNDIIVCLNDSVFKYDMDKNKWHQWIKYDLDKINGSENSNLDIKNKLLYIFKFRYQHKIPKCCRINFKTKEKKHELISLDFLQGNRFYFTSSTLLIKDKIFIFETI